MAASPTSGTSDTSGETSLDVEWAHAMAPKANILLVEVASFSFAALLHGAVYAAGQNSAAVSLSYGANDTSGQLRAPT